MPVEVDGGVEGEDAGGDACDQACGCVGEMLFEQGSRGGLVYVVEAGQIEIFKVRADHSEEPMAIRKPGEHFGELGPLLGLPRSASARALGPAVVTGYSVADFRERFGGELKVGAMLDETVPHS